MNIVFDQSLRIFRSCVQLIMEFIFAAEREQVAYHVFDGMPRQVQCF